MHQNSALLAYQYLGFAFALTPATLSLIAATPTFLVKKHVFFTIYLAVTDYLFYSVLCELGNVGLGARWR